RAGAPDRGGASGRLRALLRDVPRERPLAGGSPGLPRAPRPVRRVAASRRGRAGLRSAAAGSAAGRAFTARFSRPARAAPPPPPPGPLALLGRGAALAPLARQGWEDSSMSYGFSGGASRQQLAFLLGIHGMDLDLAVKAGDSASAEAVVARIVRLLAPLDGMQELLQFYRDQEQPLRAQGSLDGPQPRPGSPSPARPSAERLGMGRWVEACRLAALARDGSFFEQPALRSQLDALRARELSPAAQRRLASVDELLRPLPGSEADWRRLERELSQLIL